MVLAVQCTNPKCRKYMLVEDGDSDRTVPCLLCKALVKVDEGIPVAPAPRPEPPTE